MSRRMSTTITGVLEDGGEILKGEIGMTENNIGKYAVGTMYYYYYYHHYPLPQLLLLLLHYYYLY